eukprot:1107084-Prymnesium_polylepis.1
MNAYCGHPEALDAARRPRLNLGEIQHACSRNAPGMCQSHQPVAPIVPRTRRAHKEGGPHER